MEAKQIEVKISKFNRVINRRVSTIISKKELVSKYEKKIIKLKNEIASEFELIEQNYKQRNE